MPVAATGVFNKVTGSDYAFPLTKFTLNAVNSDGSIGAVLATSPKTDYCITGDNRVGDVPNTPNETSPPQSNCTDPTKPLGWSVGWGDQYDQTDAGQPIDINSIPDGTYILHAVVDPQHVLTESDPTNNATDTKLTISGNSVTIISQTNPGSTQPTVAITSPAAGSVVSGTVMVSASAAAVGTCHGGVRAAVAGRPAVGSGADSRALQLQLDDRVGGAGHSSVERPSHRQQRADGHGNTGGGDGGGAGRRLHGRQPGVADRQDQRGDAGVLDIGGG